MGICPLSVVDAGGWVNKLRHICHFGNVSFIGFRTTGVGGDGGKSGRDDAQFHECSLACLPDPGRPDAVKKGQEFSVVSGGVTCIPPRSKHTVEVSTGAFDQPVHKARQSQ